MDMSVNAKVKRAAKADAKVDYQHGFGNTFSSEEVKGALPVGRKATQRATLGL